MAIQWPVAKLDLVNRALALTGNNLVVAENDGSDEWTVCSPAYEDALAVMLEEHGWVHATRVNAALTASGTAPTDTGWDTAYDLPSDLVHLIWVRLAERPTDYDILDNQIVLNNIGAEAVQIKYVSLDSADPDQGATPLFVRALTMFVTAGIYRGLHNDNDEAARLFSAADVMSQRARTRSDQQKPKRAFFNSRITAARRIRRPWPPVPTGWGGTGVP